MIREVPSDDPIFERNEVAMTNPPSWGYHPAGGEAAQFIELSGQMASREKGGLDRVRPPDAHRGALASPISLPPP